MSEAAKEIFILASSLLSHKDRAVRDMAIVVLAYVREFGAPTK
jgi:hypothetical protein